MKAISVAGDVRIIRDPVNRAGKLPIPYTIRGNGAQNMQDTARLTTLGLAALLLLACGPEGAVRPDAQGEAEVTAAPAAQAPAPDTSNLVAAAEPAATPVPEKKFRTVAPEEPPALLTKSGLYDLDNPSFVALQNPTEALAGFPKDRRQTVDWVASVKQGLIAPRYSMDGTQPPQTMEMDVLMTNTTGMPHVLFPHQAHTEWLSCENCHPEPFQPLSNGNPVTMTKIFKGEYCGMCHDKVAFSLFICEKCHNTPVAKK